METTSTTARKVGLGRSGTIPNIVHKRCGCWVREGPRGKLCPHDIEAIKEAYDNIPVYPKTGRKVLGRLTELAHRYSVAESTISRIGKDDYNVGTKHVLTDAEVEILRAKQAKRDKRAANAAKREARKAAAAERTKQVLTESLGGHVDVHPGATERIEAQLRRNFGRGNIYHARNGKFTNLDHAASVVLPGGQKIDPSVIASTSVVRTDAKAFEHYLGMITDGFIGLLVTLESLRR